MPFSRATIAHFAEFFDPTKHPTVIRVVFDVFDSMINNESYRAEYRIVADELLALPATEPERTAAIRAIVAREAHVAYDAWQAHREKFTPTVITKSPDELLALAPVLPSEHRS